MNIYLKIQKTKRAKSLYEIFQNIATRKQNIKENMKSIIIRVEILE